MNANFWIILGTLALAFSGFAIPYGFYLRSESAKNSTPKPSVSMESHGQNNGITAKTVSIENMTVIQGGISSEQAYGQPSRGTCRIRVKSYHYPITT
jgi:hypothetical protein